MLRCRSAVAKAGVREQVEMEKLVSHLRDTGYVPLMRSAFAGACGVLGLPEPGDQLVAKAFSGWEATSRYAMRAGRGDVIGEAFLCDDAVCLVSPHGREVLRASVAAVGDADEALARFCQDVERAIRARFDGRRVKGMDFTWRPPSQRELSYEMVRYPAERADAYLGLAAPRQAKLQFREPEYSAQDLECSRFLVDDSARSFIVTLARVGKMRRKEAAEEADAQALDRFLSIGLLRQEYLLTCRQDQHTICVMPSRDAVKGEPTASLRCSVCGRGFPDENLQEIYSLTARARTLLDGSLWMSVWLTELLVENGVRREAVKWSLESQGEELDVMVEDFDSRVFLELKDREFGLGDAYPFVYRLTRYRGRIGVVATMDKVSPDAKAFFEEDVERRDFPSEVRYLEGPATIQTGIAALVREMSLSQVRRLLRPFYERLGFDLWPVVEARIGRWIGGASAAATAPTAEASAANA